MDSVKYNIIFNNEVVEVYVLIETPNPKDTQNVNGNYLQMVKL